MEINENRAVFFDCWDTLIRFKADDERWNLRPLYNHCINKDSIDWDQVFSFLESFIKKYYFSRSLYEIPVEAIHNLVRMNFDILLDCTVEQTGKEVLSYLNPEPVDNVSDFLCELEKLSIPYYVLSNTIYPMKETKDVIEKHLPGHKFGFVLASKDIGVKKPNELFFTTGVHMANKELLNSIYIGDAFFQDVYGSNKAGFNNSVWLNHKGKKAEVEYERHPGLDKIDYLEVDGYNSLIEILKDNKLWKTCI